MQKEDNSSPSSPDPQHQTLLTSALSHDPAHRAHQDRHLHPAGSSEKAKYWISLEKEIDSCTNRVDLAVALEKLDVEISDLVRVFERRKADKDSVEPATNLVSLLTVIHVFRHCRDAEWVRLARM